LGVVLDLYTGYNTGGGDDSNFSSSWNILPTDTNDVAFGNLLHRQLWPKPTEYYVPDPETAQELSITPFGDITDLILSDAEADFLRLYPVLLLTTTLNFTVTDHGDQGVETLAERLLQVLTASDSLCKELLVQQHHVTSMGSDRRETAL